MPSLPKKVEGIVEQEVEDGLLILKDNGEYLVVNRTGAKIWSLVNSVNSMEEMAKALSSLKNAPGYDECINQINRYIDQLKELGFLEENS